MSKQKPEYYKISNGTYVALNRSAKRMFNSKGIKYITPKMMNLKSLIDSKLINKGLRDGKEKKKIK